MTFLGDMAASLLLAVLAGPDDLPPVEVIESAGAVAAAREEYAARRGIREWTTLRASILRGDVNPLVAIGNRSPPSLVRELFLELHARRASLSPANRLGLGESLYGQRRIEGKEILFELLGEPDAEIRRKAIDRIHWGAAENDWSLAFTAGDLERLRASLEDPDDSVRRTARDACGHFGVPGAEVRLIEWLRQGARSDDNEARRLLSWCSSGYHASETWRTFLIEVLGEGSKPVDAHLVVPAARANLSHPDRRVAELAERRCEDDFLARAATLEDWFQHPATLSRFAGKRSAPLIKRALAAPAPGYQSSEQFRMWALEAYGRAIPEKAAPYLLDVLDGAGKGLDARGAILGLMHAADSASAPVWTARILKKLDSRPAVLSFDAVAPLFLARGGDAGRRLVVERFHQLGVRERFSVLGALRGTAPRDIFSDFQAAGLIRAVPDRELVASVGRSSGVDPGSVAIVEPVLIATGDVIHFDAEADEIPVRHDVLTEWLADRTGGAFRIQDVWQTWNRTSETSREGDYTVSFSIGDRLFRFRARDRQDWYDIEAVMQALNETLERAGRRERFQDIFASGQSVSYIFADEEKLAAVCRKYLIPFGGSGDAAREAGMKFEKHVLEALGKE